MKTIYIGSCIKCLRNFTRQIIFISTSKQNNKYFFLLIISSKSVKICLNHTTCKKKDNINSW